MEDFVPTRASKEKIRDAANNYISVNYEPYKKLKSTGSLDKRKKSQQGCSVDAKMKQTDPADLKRQQEKEMKKVRYEIIKFGMSGFEKTKAKKAKVDLAISLGAKPPKNRRMNYKRLMALRKKEKEEEKECISASGFTSSLRKPKIKKTRKKDPGILRIYGKVSKEILSKNQKN